MIGWLIARYSYTWPVTADRMAGRMADIARGAATLSGGAAEIAAVHSSVECTPETPSQLQGSPRDRPAPSSPTFAPCASGRRLSPVFVRMLSLLVLLAPAGAAEIDECKGVEEWKRDRKPLFSDLDVHPTVCPRPSCAPLQRKPSARFTRQTKTPN